MTEENRFKKRIEILARSNLIVFSSMETYRRGLLSYTEALEFLAVNLASENERLEKELKKNKVEPTSREELQKKASEMVNKVLDDYNNS